MPVFKHSSHGIAYRTVIRFESCPIKYFMIADDVNEELLYSVIISVSIWIHWHCQFVIFSYVLYMYSFEY